MAKKSIEEQKAELQARLDYLEVVEEVVDKLKKELRWYACDLQKDENGEDIWIAHDDEYFAEHPYDRKWANGYKQIIKLLEESV